jgi:hypothetical protein
MHTKLNILVEDAGPNHYKCINTRIIEKLRGWQKHPRIVWQKGNLHVWRLMQQNKQHFNFVAVKDYDINDDTPTIYLVTIPFINDHLNTTWVNFLPDNTCKILKDKNIPIVLSQPHEYFLGHLNHHSYGFHYPTQELTLFDSALSQRGLINNDIIIHGIALSKTKQGYFPVGQRRVYEAYCYDYFNSGREFLKKMHQHDLEKPDMEKYKFLSVNDHLDVAPQKDKLSICLNRQPRDLRCILLLSNEKHMDESIFTFLAEDPLHVPMSKEEIYERFSSVLYGLPDTEYTKGLFGSIEPLMSRIPMELEERGNERKDHMNANYVLNEQRKRVWFEMVTETHEWNRKDHSVAIITEKTIWPILNSLPFCVQGHKENYSFLKDLGFNVFEDILLTEEAVKRDLVHDDLNKSLLYAVDQMYERWNDIQRNGKFILNNKDRINHNLNLLADVDWQEKEKNDFIKILNHGKEAGTSFDLPFKDQFKF